MFEVVADDGLIPPAADHTMNMFVPHLLFGYACMNFFSYLSCDLALLRGKVGCRPGAFMLYYPCRYLSLLSMVTLLVYYDSSQKPELEILTCVSQAASALSLGFGLSILVARICILYKNKYLSLFMHLVLLAMWGLLLCSTSLRYHRCRCLLKPHLVDMEDVTQPGVLHLHVVLHATEGIMMVSIPVLGLVLALFYVLVVAKHEHNFRVRDCLRMMWDTDCAEYALICIIAVPSTVLYLLDISDSGSCHLALGYTAFVTIVITAARIYRKMLHRLDPCPINFGLVTIYRWLKEGAMFVAGKMGLKPRSSPSQSSQAPPPNEAPQLGSQRASQSLALSILDGRPRQANKRACLPAHSRSTYAHSSLYESQAS